MDIQQSCFSGVMLAVGRLVGIEKTIGDKVSSKSRFYNTFDYFARYTQNTVAKMAIASSIRENISQTVNNTAMVTVNHP